MAKLKIAVLFGGASKDHDVSLKSAYSVLNGLSPSKYEIIPIGITKAGRWLYYPGSYEAVADGSWESDPDCCPAIISPDYVHHGIMKFFGNDDVSGQRVDVVFSLLHGKYGESGRIQSLCKLAGITFMGSGPEASCNCLDKMQSRMMLNKAGIDTVSYYYFERSEMTNLDKNIEKMENVLSYPVYVKPASCSSAIGANIAFDREELVNALKIAFSHHHKAIADQTLNGRELSCAVYENMGKVFTTGISEVVRSQSAIDENCNFIAKTGTLQYPAELSKQQEDKIKATAEKIFRVMDCSGFARMDFTLCDENLYCCKIATMPGFSEESVFPVLMKSAGFSFEEMLDMLIENALENKS